MSDFPYLLDGRRWTIKQLAQASGLSTYRVVSVVQEVHPQTMAELKAGAAKQLTKPLPRVQHAAQHTRFNIRLKKETP